MDGFGWGKAVALHSVHRTTVWEMLEMLRAQGVALLSLEEKIDTSSAAGELIFHVFGAIAHFERRLISERTRGGIAAARAKSKQPGRQPLDYLQGNAQARHRTPSMKSRPRRSAMKLEPQNQQFSVAF